MNRRCLAMRFAREGILIPCFPLRVTRGASPRSRSVTYSATAAVGKSAQDHVANMIDMVIAGSQITR